MDIAYRIGLKKDESPRFCVYYHHPNSATERDSYPIPKMDVCIDSLAEAQVLSILRAKSMYWQIEMDENDIEKTVFVTHHGLFKYTRMAFGLKSAPATFQCATNVILALVKWQHPFVYIDDIISFSKIPRRLHKAYRRSATLINESRCHNQAKKFHF